MLILMVLMLLVMMPLQMKRFLMVFRLHTQPAAMKTITNANSLTPVVMSG